MEGDHDERASAITRAQEMAKKVWAETNTKDDMIRLYRDWSSLYEKDTSLGYNGPSICAEAVSQYIIGQTEASILDVGAGTGLLGLELSKRQFTNIEALEPSEDMLKIAAQKKVYQKLHVSFFTDDMAFMEDNSYDAIAIGSALGAPHIEPQALKEFVRIVKPGGYVFIVSGKRLLTSGMAIFDEMRYLEEKKLWCQLEKRIVSNYWLDENGLLLVFKITKQK